MNMFHVEHFRGLLPLFLTPDAHLAMEILADHGRFLSFEIVEVNPVINEHNITADLAVELASSAFGKKIL